MIKSNFLLILIILSNISCSENAKKNVNEDSKIISKDSLEIYNIENKEKDSSLPIKQIISLAKKDFSAYKKNLLSKNTTIGLDDAYTGDFTNDGKEDVVIYYSIEPTDGGNYLVGQGLVLYKNNGNTVTFITNYTPDYLFSFDKVSGGNIFISKDEYAEDDPRCCPSLHKQIELTVNGNKIYERNIK